MLYYFEGENIEKKPDEFHELDEAALKEIAKKMGYNIIKKPVSERYLPCICGAKRREYGFDTKIGSYVVYCQKCSFEARANSYSGLKKAWNEKVRNEQTTKDETVQET